MTTITTPAVDADRYALSVGNSGIWIVCQECSGDDQIVGVLSDHRVRHTAVQALMAEHDTDHHHPAEPQCIICAAEPVWNGPPITAPISAPPPVEGLCIGCAFWVTAVKSRFAPGRLLDRTATGAPVARIDGRLYTMEPDPPRGTVAMRGHGGKTFTIRYFTGKAVTGSNLWDCGEIPARWRPLLPDNAVFGREPDPQ
ncbi:hypothetical protein KGQ19_47575 [Catenulispora sp. NL8]|uniref:Uncharacterized protein n=1 Tax=Catenulispora pinistramenti TaxID=2705254 RepID=A0ABS5L851_9ACTN|nr:hypothetical protein [Catenulispora pinistramenti]MBS2554540.1 hypothetical protein [Catenulispora pinistramenti]